MAKRNMSEERRNDPVLRAKVEKINDDRRDALLKAAADLKKIVDAMRPYELDGDDAIYSRCFYAVRRAYSSVYGDAEFEKKIGGECYIGNLAAGQLGEYVVEKGL